MHKISSLKLSVILTATFISFSSLAHDTVSAIAVERQPDSSNTVFEDAVNEHLQRSRIQDIANELTYRSVNNIGCSDFSQYFQEELLPRLEALKQRNISLDRLKNLVWDYSKRRYSRFNQQYGVSTEALINLYQDYLATGSLEENNLNSLNSLGSRYRIPCLNVRPSSQTSSASEDTADFSNEPSDTIETPEHDPFPRLQMTPESDDLTQNQEPVVEETPSSTTSQTIAQTSHESSSTQTAQTTAPAHPTTGVSRTSSQDFVYAGKGALTPIRVHPSQVEKLPFMRKRHQIKVEGVGFSFWHESVFKNNVNMMTDSHYSPNGKTGTQFIKALEDYTKRKGCIPHLLIAGHGHYIKGSRGRESAISSKGRGQIFYRSSQSQSSRISIEGILASKINSGSIKFCSSCEINLHACSIAHSFSESLAKTTGCRVVSATGKVTPISPTHTSGRTNRKHYPNVGEYEQYWFTSGSNNDFYEYLPNGKKAKIGKSFVMDPAVTQKRAKPFE